MPVRALYSKCSLSMKIITWNVNGIRSVLQKGFLEFVSREKPDLLCLQEVKALPEQVSLSVPGYELFWNPAERKGYSGVLIMSKIPPDRCTLGMGKKEHDEEGRVITLEFEDFYLTAVYTPNSGRGLTRLEYRETWDREFLKFIKKLEKKKPVIFCGDTNVAHQEIDLKNPAQNRKNAGFTDEERAGFSRLLAAGYTDSFRHFVQEGGHYTWWTYRNNARERNIGWRLDYVCVSNVLLPRLKKAFILKDVLGSDHCPAGIILD